MQRQNPSNFFLLLKKRISDIFFSLYITLFIPFLSFFSSNLELDISIKNVKYSFIWAIILIILLLNFDGRKRIFFLWTLFLVSIMPAIIILSYYILDNNIFMTSELFYPLYTTYKKETVEFINTYLKWELVVGVVLYLIYPIVYLVKLNKSYLNIARQQLISGINVLFLKNKTLNYRIISIVVAFLLSLFFINRPHHFEDVYYVDFYSTYFKYKKTIQKLEESLADRNQNLDKYDVNCILPDSVAKTFVFIMLIFRI